MIKRFEKRFATNSLFCKEESNSDINDVLRQIMEMLFMKLKVQIPLSVLVKTFKSTALHFILKNHFKIIR